MQISGRLFLLRNLSVTLTSIFTFCIVHLLGHFRVPLEYTIFLIITGCGEQNHCCIQYNL